MPAGVRDGDAAGAAGRFHVRIVQNHQRPTRARAPRRLASAVSEGRARMARRPDTAGEAA